MDDWDQRKQSKKREYQAVHFDRKLKHDGSEIGDRCGADSYVKLYKYSMMASFRTH